MDDYISRYGNWEDIAGNESINWDIVIGRSYMDRSYLIDNIKNITFSPFEVDWEIIKNNPEGWDYQKLSTTKKLDWNYIMCNCEKDWNWYILSKRVECE